MKTDRNILKALDKILILLQKKHDIDLSLETEFDLKLILRDLANSTYYPSDEEADEMRKEYEQTTKI